MLIWFLTAPAEPKSSDEIPEHPADIKYSELNWEIPLGIGYRDTIEDRILLYTAYDKSLPLVNLKGYIDYGSLMEPQDKRGMASLYTRLLRNGGTETISPDSLDMLLEKYAIDISFSAGKDQINITGSFLSEYRQEALDLVARMLLNPGFDSKRFNKERDIMIQNTKHRFEEPSKVLGIGYRYYMYPNTVYSRLSTEKTLNNIRIKDLKEFHSKVMNTPFPVFAVSGDIDKKVIKDFFRDRISADLTSNSEPTEYPIIEVRKENPVRALIHKKTSQAYIKMGLATVQRPDKDYYPLSILNHILGGGGFTSRLTAKIRVKHGLAYSVYSSSGSDYTIPSTLSITLSTKTGSVNQAAYMVVQECKKLLEKGITEKELEDAKKSLIDELPSYFRDKGDIVETYAWNSLRNRSDDHYKVYPEIIRGLSKSDIMNAAEKYLKPEHFSIIVTGDTTGIMKAKPFQGFSIEYSDTISPKDLEE